MHAHLLFTHPLFEERPIKDILEPFGFLIHIDTHEFADELGDENEYAQYCADSEAYITQLHNTAPAGYIEVLRGENEDGYIIASVLPTTFSAQLILMADSEYAGPNSIDTGAFSEVYRERLRQLMMEGFSRDRDDHYQHGELARAATAYVSVAATALDKGHQDTSKTLFSHWPWNREWWKPTTPRRDLIKAGALILAEIERIDRAAGKAQAAEGAE